MSCRELKAILQSSNTRVLVEQRCKMLTCWSSCSQSLPIKHAKQRVASISRRTNGRARRMLAFAASLSDVDVLSSVNIEHQEEGEYCMPGLVAVQGDDGPYTLISVQVKDYPGLLRVVAWVLNGLELVVKEAKLKIDEDGFAHNKFWVVDRANQKLTKPAADLTAERLGDYLVYCTPNTKAMQTKIFREGPVTVDNEEHSKLTVVTVLVDLNIEGALLKVTSALTNSGCSIQEGTVKTSSNSPDEFTTQDARTFKFLVTDRSGNKLDYQRATSLVYTVGLVFGKCEGPLTAPNLGFIATSAF